MGYKSEVHETLFALGLVCFGVMLGTYITKPDPPASQTPEEIIEKAPKCYVLGWEVPDNVKLYEEKE